MPDKQRPQGPADNPFLDTWVKGVTDFWSQVAALWSSSPGETTGATGADDESDPESGVKMPKGAMERLEGAWRLAAKASQTALSSLQNPQTMEGLIAGSQVAPQVGLQMAGVFWEGYTRLWQQWADKAASLARRTEPYDFDDVNPEHFRVWGEIYEKDFQRFLHVPQLGLTRTYQEKVNLVMDKLNVFQGKMSEFFLVLYAPLEKSLRYMQQKLEEEYDEGGPSDDFKNYYQAWLKILEGHYMTLFTSPEYVSVLTETLTTMEDFISVRRSLLEDLLKALPVPTLKEMDEVCQELYLLKKEVRQLKRAAK